MKRFKNKRKVVSLSLVTIAYVLIVTPLIISNLQKQHAKVQGAQTTRNADLAANISGQSIESECIPDGTVGIGALYTNQTTEAVSVSVSDSTTGNVVNLGVIRPGVTKIGTILTKKATVPNGSVTFSITSSSQTLQKAEDYLSISCSE